MFHSSISIISRIHACNFLRQNIVNKFSILLNRSVHFIVTGMSFCQGSVNCHLSDGRMDHFCESSKTVEFFTGV